MKCEMSIEFFPSNGIMSTMLEKIEHRGFWLHGIRLIPGMPEHRSTLQVDLGGCHDHDQLCDLEIELQQIDPTMTIIQLAGAPRH
jgi:hypothetical protein